jgi:hypothetical protein
LAKKRENQRGWFLIAWEPRMYGLMDGSHVYKTRDYVHGTENQTAMQRRRWGRWDVAVAKEWRVSFSPSARAGIMLALTMHKVRLTWRPGTWTTSDDLVNAKHTSDDTCILRLSLFQPSLY